MTFEEAIELFYNDPEVQDQFDYWEMDGAIAKVSLLISDIEEIVEQRKKQELKNRR